MELGLKKVTASKLACDWVFKQNSTIYKARKIREYVQEYLQSNSITRGAQGKHSKRVSVLDDEDIKKKVVEWFRRHLKCYIHR
jgi:hypothetical protein